MNSYLILGGHITQATNDRRQLEPALKDLDKLPGRLGRITRLAADASYFSQDNVDCVIKQKATPYIAIDRQQHHPDWKERLADPGPPPGDPTPVEAMA